MLDSDRSGTFTISGTSATVNCATARTDSSLFIGYRGGGTGSISNPGIAFSAGSTGGTFNISGGTNGAVYSYMVIN